MNFIIFKQESDQMWHARNNFFNTPEDSPEGLGHSPEEALTDLLEQMRK